MLPDELSHTLTTDLISSEQDAHFHGSRKKEPLTQPPMKEQIHKQEVAGKGNQWEWVIHMPRHTGFISSTSDCRIIAVLFVNAKSTQRRDYVKTKQYLGYNLLNFLKRDGEVS